MAKHVKPKIRSIIKSFGGKSYLARRFIKVFPACRTYIEPFLGGGSILLNREPGYHEIANDIDPGIMAAWFALQQEPQALIASLANTPYEQESFENAAKHLFDTNIISRGWAYIVRNRMSRGGMMKDFAWSNRLRGKKSESGPIPGELNSWHTFLNNDLIACANRVSCVELQCKNAMDIIYEHRTDTRALCYLDPPYTAATRVSKLVYGFETTEAWHQELLDLIKRCSCMVALSGYHSPLYDEELRDFYCIEFNMPNHSGQNKLKQRRIECLWFNAPAAPAIQQKFAFLHGNQDG